MKIGYARVSTLQQDLSLQLDALKAAGCEKIFEDQMSGAKDDRPGLAAAIGFARTGDVLMVWRLDRLGRSMKHLVATVGDIQKAGIGFESLTEKIETVTATGRLVFHIFGALAEFERSLTAETVQAGLAAARARGRMGGRPGVPDGTINAIRALSVDRDRSPAEICKTLKISRATFYKYAAASAISAVSSTHSK